MYFVTLLYRLIAPNIARNVRHQLQLVALILIRDTIAFHGGGEAALWAESKPLQRNNAGSFLDALSQLSSRFQLWLLSCHQPKYDNAIFGHMAQGCKAAGALIIVFEQEALK